MKSKDAAQTASTRVEASPPVDKRALARGNNHPDADGADTVRRAQPGGELSLQSAERQIAAFFALE